MQNLFKYFSQFIIILKKFFFSYYSPKFFFCIFTNIFCICFFYFYCFFSFSLISEIFSPFCIILTLFRFFFIFCIYLLLRFAVFHAPQGVKQKFSTKIQKIYLPNADNHSILLLIIDFFTKIFSKHFCQRSNFLQLYSFFNSAAFLLALVLCAEEKNENIMIFQLFSLNLLWFSF